MSNKIGRLQGGALLATTLLGTSVFILPQMTINIAQFEAIWAWVLLTIAILPVALIFAKLSAKYPHAAGPAYFIEQAFGPVWGRTIGMSFLFVVPLGTPAAILMTLQFVDALIPLSSMGILFAELIILLTLFGLNYKGVQLSATLQLALTIAITFVVLMLIVLAQGQDNIATMPTLTMNEFPVLSAAGIAFWSFLGIEAMSHLAHEFKNPERDLVPAIFIGTLLVGLIYIGCTWLQLHFDSETPLALVGIFQQLTGLDGKVLIGVLGIAGGLATVNVYTASLARLAWSFAQQGILPKYLCKQNKYGVPISALNTLLFVMAIVLALTLVTGIDLEDLIRYVNGVFILIYLGSMMAAYKLLSKNTRVFTLMGFGFCAAIIVGLGLNMLYAVAVLAITFPFIRWQYRVKLSKSIS
jgi:amino acid efflux transporter